MPHETDRVSYVPPPGWLDRRQGVVRGVSLRFVAVATLLGALLRLAGLGRQSLWVDEILTWQMVRPGVGLVFWEQMRDAIQGPLYLAVVWPLVRAFPPEMVLRLPAAVAGVLAIPLFAVLAARLLDRRSAHLAVLLLAINPFHVWYSQEARGYSLVVLFVLAMTWCFLVMLEEGPTLRRALLFALAAAAAVLSNMSGIFVWAALGLTLLARPPRGARAWGLWVLAFGGGLLAMMPWLLQAAGIWAVDRVLPGTATGVVLRGSATLEPLAVPYTFFTFFYGFSLGPSLRELHEPDRMDHLRAWLPLLAVAVLPVLAGGLVGSWRLLRRRWPLLLWIAVPLALMVFLAVRNVKPWNARYLAVALPWVLAVAAAGLTGLPRRWGAGAATLLCLLSLVALGGQQFADRYAKADLRAAAAHVVAANSDGEAVFVPVVTAVYDFYDDSGAPLIDTWGASALGTAADATALVAERLAGRSSCWVVLARDWQLDPRGLLVPALARTGQVEPVFRGAGVRVLHWRRTAHGGGPDGR